MHFLRLQWYTMLYFTHLQNRYYQFILFFQPLIFLFMVKFMLMMRPAVHEGKYIIAVALVSMWYLVLYFTGSALVSERWSGTFETVFGSRTSLYKVVLTRSVNNAMIGLFTLLLTLVYAKFLFGFQIEIANLPLFLLSVMALLLGLTAIGAVLAILFALFTEVIEYQNLIVYPLLLLSGVFYPVSAYPQGVQWLAGLFPTTWSIKSVYGAIETPGAFYSFDLFAGIGVSLLYLLIALLLMKKIEMKFRETNEVGVF